MNSILSFSLLSINDYTNILCRFIKCEHVEQYSPVVSVPTFFSQEERNSLVNSLTFSNTNPPMLLHDTTACLTFIFLSYDNTFFFNLFLYCSFISKFTFPLSLISIPNTTAITFMQSLSGSVFPIFDFLIIDFGAKGLLASMFHLEVNKELRCLSHAYTPQMSGDVIDDILFQHFEPFVKEAWEEKQNESQNESTLEAKNKMLMRTMQNLRKTVQQMKTLTNIASDIAGPVTLIPFDEDIEVKMTLAEFESLLRRDLEVWVQRTLEIVLKQALERIGYLNLQYVRWTGGSSQLLLFQTIVKEFFRNQGLFNPFYLS